MRTGADMAAAAVVSAAHDPSVSWPQSCRTRACQLQSPQASICAWFVLPLLRDNV